MADHDLNEHIVAGVLRREPTIQFVRLRNLGMSGADDDAVLTHADRANLIVVSHDVNTMPAVARRRIAQGSTHAGLLLVQQSEPIREVIEAIVFVWSASELEEWRNQTAFLPFD